MSKYRGCEEPKYQEEIVFHRISSEWSKMSSGNGIVKSGGIWVGLWSKNLADEVIEVEWHRLIPLLHIGQ